MALPQRQLASFERRTDSPAPVLTVTNLWPSSERPVYGVMVRRQVDSVGNLGIESDVLNIRGYASPLAYLGAAIKLLALNFSRRRYRLVHVHAGETFLVARLYLRAPVLVSFMGGDLLGATRADGSLPLSWRVRTRVIRQASRTATATITKSAEMAEVLPREVAERNTVLPNGIDRRLFSPMPRDEARAALGWSTEERVALFVGTAHKPRKRLGLAQEACDAAADSLDLVRLHIADGVEPEQIPLLMNAADCLLHPAASEGSPNVVKEALACNLPVVATPVGDIPLLLDGVAPSHLCRPEAGELAAALVDVLRSPVRSNGRDRTEWLAEERIAQRLVEIYDRIAPVERELAGRS